ncbi:hypothetical protein Asulf_01740 [Archaeoglobus sulfaticallidus PM70-1]|uniref:DUF447 family protein n=1 Tax=Archaeoglobus sulfaticallidus PM70-1 TaxID=387631 RepID=N0BM71_9EURY|nr:DUF447 domain-containing protein [Archaeoglobus sulfaticallidus]AGK61711.1 hypothetical protein Asulf_01740 [Archaeoglobus sulfaticallidus PM70-1]
MKLKDFGFQKGINEIIGITVGEWINTAPLGIIVDNPDSRFARVRLYSNHTRENIKRNDRLWVNVVNDAVLFALASFEDLSEDFFESLNPPILINSLAWCGMRAKLKGAFAELELLSGEVIRKDVRAVNRGFNAIIEALVHATRLVAFKDPSKRVELKERVEYYLALAEKCGGEREIEAAKIIREKIER